MPLESADDITKAVDARIIELQPLYDRLESDYGLWRLEKFSLGSDTDYDNYTSNEPRAEANKVVRMLERAHRVFRIDIKGDDAERNNISAAERFIVGSLNLADYRLRTRPGNPTIQSSAAWYAVVRGWIVRKCYIHKNEKRQTIPDIANWDIRNTVWQEGERGLLWVCHIRKAKRAQVKAEYGIDLKEDVSETTIYDFWDEEANTIIVNSQEAKERTKHGLDYIPILIINVGSNPPVQSSKYTDTIKDLGEPIFSANREVFPVKSKLMTYYLTTVGLGAHNPLVVYSPGAKRGFQKSPYYKGSVIQMDSDDPRERVEPLFNPQLPGEILKVSAEIQRELDIGGVPPIGFGLAPFPSSGFEANILLDVGNSVIFPFLQTMEFADEWTARELLSQYSKGGFKPLRIYGRDNSNVYFDMKVAPKDIKGDWFPEVTYSPKLPEDDVGKFAMMAQAVEKKIFSVLTAQDKLGIQDPDEESRQIARETGEAMPIIQFRKIAAAYIALGRPDLAAPFIAEIQRMETSAVTPGETTPASDAVEPQFASGFPRTVLPSEELGKVQR